MLDEVQERSLERLGKVDALPGYKVVVCTVSEFKVMLAKRNTLVVENLNGVVLRDDHNMFRKLS